MNHSNISRVFLLIIVGTVLFIFFLYGTAPKEESFYTEYGCVRSVCIKHSVIGESCIVLDLMLSKIVIEKDPVQERALNILVTPSENQCK